MSLPPSLERRPWALVVTALLAASLVGSLGPHARCLPAAAGALALAGWARARGQGGLACFVALGALALLRVGGEAPPDAREPGELRLEGSVGTPAEHPSGSPGPAVDPAQVERLGRWRARGSLAVLETTGAAAEESGPAPGLFVTRGPAPADGERVRLLAGRQGLQRVRGPVPEASRAQEGGLEIVPPDLLVRLEPAPGSAWEVLGEGLRSGLLRRAGQREPRPGRGLLAALLLGERHGLDPELRALFTRTGTSHLLAVSGLHAGLVFALFLLPLGALLRRALALLHRRARRPWREDSRELWVRGVQACLVLAYVGLAGGAPPVRRAGVALALGLVAPVVARERGAPPRRVDALSLWCLALALECLASPGAWLGLGVQLSYAATLGLLLLFPPLATRLRPLFPAPPAERDRHGRRRSPLWRLPAVWIARAAPGAAAASLAAFLATLPSVAATFGEGAPAGALATPLLVPVLAGVLLFGWIGLLLPAAPATALVQPALELFVGLVQLVDRMGGTPLPYPPRPTWLSVAAVLALAAALLSKGPRGRRAARLAAAGWGLWLLPWATAPAGLELHALDVGHGSAVLLRAPGLPALVFDAGTRDRTGLATSGLAPQLARWEVTRPVVVLSHEHADHRSALPWLVERFPPRAWLGAPPRRARLPADCVVLDLEAGALELSPGWLGRRPGEPPGPWSVSILRGSPAEGNEGSRTLSLTHREGERLLLFGDAEGAGLGALLDSGALAGPTRLVLFPHHGSDTPHLGLLLAETRPQEVWISAGHPPGASAPPVVPELERRALPWRWTARDGCLSLGPLPDRRSRRSAGPIGAGPSENEGPGAS